MSSEFSKRLNAAIPGGAHTYSRGDDQFPANAPPILVRGSGSYVWAPDGRRFLDYGMALRSVTLGYANERVNAAAIKQIELGNNLTRASVTELEAAELIIDLIPSIEMVKFAKNGSNVTTAAVKIARAFTQRRYVCVPRQQPFFSFDDWFIGTTSVKRGIPPEHVSSTLLFDFGNIESLRELFVKYPGEIAAVMMEPATTQIPCAGECIAELVYDSPCFTCPHRLSNFLLQVQKLCRADGALFILDEMITGFRWNIQGAQTYFGVSPDLTTFGKAMANGFSVAAVGGRRDVMEVGAVNTEATERTFLLSTTHGGEMCGLGALIETVNVYRSEDVCRHLWSFGRRLRDGMREMAKKHGLESHFLIEGPAISLNYSTLDREGERSMAMRTLFSQEMIKNGVLMPWIAVSLTHAEAELDLTMAALDKSLAVYSKAVNGTVDKYLEGAAIKPVFRRYN
jgi:glutamate-1-semialdehyde 2,1-aminomutase